MCILESRLRMLWRLTAVLTPPAPMKPLSSVGIQDCWAPLLDFNLNEAEQRTAGWQGCLRPDSRRPSELKESFRRVTAEVPFVQSFQISAAE